MNVDLKIYKAVLTLQTEKGENEGYEQVIYFVNRFEIGHMNHGGRSVYEK